MTRLAHPLLLRLLALTVAALALQPLAAQAQDWPTKPVRLISSFPPGTPGDVIARLIQPALQAAWKQPVIVDNKPGAGGNLAALEVAHARDDHTLLVGPDTILTINPHLYKQLNIDLRAALQPVTYLASFNQTLVCNPQAQIGSLQAFSQLPATALYASGGTGSPSHMTMELLLTTLGTQLVHVPYKGPGPAALDVMARHVDCGFIVSSVVLPYVQSKRLQPIAVSGQTRSVQMPTVPTIAESGYPGFDATFFETLLAPASMPAARIDQIRSDVRTAIEAPAVKARLAEIDLRVEATTPQEARRRSEQDYAKWGAVAQRAKIQLD